MGGRRGIEPRAGAREIGHDAQRKALTGTIIIDTAQDHWATQTRRANDELLARHPQRAVDASIERPVRIVIGHRAAERETQEAEVALGLLPKVHPDERLGPKPPGGFLECLANDRIDDAFAPLDVAGRLVEDHAIPGALLDEQKLAVSLDDRGDG